MFTNDTVTVITAATGHLFLPRCIASVQQQTYRKVEHWIVVDGAERQAKVQHILETLLPAGHPRRLISLPEATGKDNWNGHRIYAAMSFLVNSEFVCYLDEDNWYDPDHVESLVAALRNTSGARWAFSLRKIVDQRGQFVAMDNCDSLGPLHHVYYERDDYHIDTSCYLLTRTAAVAGSAVWYRPTRVKPGTTILGQIYRGTDLRLEPDNAFCRTLMQNFSPAASNRKHTLNYTIANRPDSVNAEHFLHGNQMMKLMYPDGLPWEK